MLSAQSMQRSCITLFSTQYRETYSSVQPAHGLSSDLAPSPSALILVSVTAARRVRIKPSLLQRAPSTGDPTQPSPPSWQKQILLPHHGDQTDALLERDLTGCTNYPQFQPCWEGKTFHEGFNKNPITFAFKAHWFLGSLRFSFFFPWDKNTEHSHLSLKLQVLSFVSSKTLPLPPELPGSWNRCGQTHHLGLFRAFSALPQQLDIQWHFQTKSAETWVHPSNS